MADFQICISVTIGRPEELLPPSPPPYVRKHLIFALPPSPPPSLKVDVICVSPLTRKRKIHRRGTRYLKQALNNFWGKTNNTNWENGSFESQRGEKGYRSSHQRCSLKKGRQLCLGLFFNKVAGLGPATLLKKDSGTGVFLWILQNF